MMPGRVCLFSLLASFSLPDSSSFFFFFFFFFFLRVVFLGAG